MAWIYLSPHFDDVALSCGGLVWEQAGGPETRQVWTIFSGEPPSGPLTPFAETLHNRWQVSAGEAVKQRAEEDKAAMEILRVPARYFGFPDCIYRRLPDGAPLVQAEEDLWQPIHPGETGLAKELEEMLRAVIPEHATLVSPFGLGEHVDHRLVRQAAERLLVTGRVSQLLYYADYPYAVKSSRNTGTESMPGQIYPVSKEGLIAWQDAVQAYTSQLSSFWGSTEEMRAAIQAYCEAGDGVRLFVHP
jgi:LmbE family N-acetylglucosaminyl deacetylase